MDGWLGREKATEIIQAVIKDDNVFHCHKTVDYSHSMTGRVTQGSRLCAGSIVLHKKEGRPNYIYRLVDHTVGGNSLVVDSAEAFIKKHSYSDSLAPYRRETMG